MKSNFMDLDDLQLDILREVSNIGVGNASIALSKMMGSKIDLSIPTINILQLNKVIELVGEGDRHIAGIHFKILGDAHGNILMILPKISAFQLIGLLLKKEIEASTDLEEVDYSVLRETGNILTSAYLSAISKMLNISLFPSVPGLIIDTSKRVMQQIMTEMEHPEGVSAILETRFKEKNSSVHGRIFLALDKDSIAKIIEAARELPSQ